MPAPSRPLAATLLVALYMALFVVATSLTWTPARGDAAILVRQPIGLVAGAGLLGGEPWIVVEGKHNSTLFIGETPYRLDGLRATTACSDGNRIVVAGLTGRNKTIVLLDRARITARVSLSIAPTPRYCDARGGVTAVLFSDPVVWSYAAIIRPDNTMSLVRLAGLPRAPTRIAILNGTSVALMGSGYYAILQINGASARLTVHNITIGNKVPTITGAATSSGRLLVVGYVPGSGKAPDRGLVGVIPGRWLIVSPERADRSLKIHAVDTSRGTPRLVVEIVGRETQIVEMRGERTGPSVSLSTLAPYILRGVRAGPGYFVITGELFLRENNETVRSKAAYIIGSVARFSLASGPTDAVLITRRASPITVHVLGNVSDVSGAPQEGLRVTYYELGHLDKALDAGRGAARVYDVYVDRSLLFCALAAVTSAYAIPLAALVSSYNRMDEDRRA